ncbi:MAG: ABC transporter permease [Anaerolineales bacterium]|nr:ABC transporter permease [Anaerolineales bacterium]
MTYAEFAETQDKSALRPLARAIYFWRKTFNIFEMELRKIRHDPFNLLTRAIQPLLWMLIFGQVLAGARGIPTGGFSYIEFMAPGILAQSVLFVSIFYGLALIWERDLGIIHKFLASPAPRTALVLGKGLGAGIRGCSQATIVLLTMWLMGVNVDWNILKLLAVFATVLLGSVVFATLSLIIAIWMKERERFMGVGQVLTMPLFFASNAIYPISMMPDWLQRISMFNPLTYMVDALRALILVGAESSYGLGFDLGLLAVVGVILIAIAAKIYPSFIT